jgi:tetratricopeptide (TPR) repeat protein
VADGEQVYMRGRFDSARVIWSQTLRLSRQQHDSLIEGRVLTWLGLAAWRQGAYPEARRLGEQALELKRRWSLRTELSKSYNALGLLAWNEGRLSEATALFGQALGSAQAAADAKATASASGNLALVETELGDFEAARRGFDSMRVAAHVLGDARIEGNAHTNLGMLFVRTGEPQSAVPELESARRLYRSAGYSTGEQNALAQLGVAYTALGEPHRALAALDSALEISRAQGLRQEEAGNLEAIAELYREAGDLWRALTLLDKASAINRALDLEVEAGADARSQAEIQASLGSLASARKLADTALAVHRAAGARYEELSDLLLLADLADRSGMTRECDVRLSQAHALAGRLRARLGRAEVVLAEARIAARRGQTSRVLAVLRRVQTDLFAGGYGMEQEALRLEAGALARAGQLDSAVAEGRRAVAAVERVRGRYASSYLRTTYLSDNQAAYGELAAMLVRQGHAGQAFEVADAARVRALLEYTVGEHAVIASSRVGEDGGEGERLLETAAALAHELGDAEREAANEGSSDAASRVEHLDRMLRSVRDDYEDLQVRRGEADPGGFARPGLGQVEPARVRQALAPGEALLEYQPLADSVIVFVVRRDTIAASVIPLSTSRLLGRVRFARGLLVQSNAAKVRADPVLGALYHDLVGEAREAGLLRGVRDLLIIPQGVLAYLPFAALRDPGTGRYLAEDYGLRLLPSAASQVALAVPRSASARAMPASVLAPLPGELPGTAAEARSVRRSLPHAVLYLGRHADEPTARAALASGGLVHLATHAVMNARNPMFSRIEMAPGRVDRPEDDGELEVHEILQIRMSSPLVFLSGCETGLGASWATDFAPGEDYATLARAFLYAGARNVIATLWPVEDEGAGEFARRFYRHLATMPVAEALAASQRDMMAVPRYAAPYYWAGYVLSGDGRVGGTEGNSAAVSVR